ncbi:hypothetical protein [Tateyamaria sp.]|uniref:hypothetical protein n=1 Tax=Tateyamaria sp. TaxID=1929288 RepID=UPI00329C13D7
MVRRNIKELSRADAAIPTEFDGVTYRSKTEARWAVFFNRLGVNFTYEERAFKLPDGRIYTPDFFVEDFNAIIEVKPNDEAIVLDEADKIVAVHHQHKTFKTWLAIGPPDETESNIIDLSIVDRWEGMMGEKLMALGQLKIEDFWKAAAIRSQISEDRRDPFVYWLSGPEQNPYGYAIGGPGKSTDHFRAPVLHWNVQEAYRISQKAFKAKAAGPKPWGGDIEETTRQYLNC